MAEAKAVMNLPLWIREIDARYLQGHHFALKLIEKYSWDRGSLLFRPQKA